MDESYKIVGVQRMAKGALRPIFKPAQPILALMYLYKQLNNGFNGWVRVSDVKFPCWAKTFNSTRQGVIRQLHIGAYIQIFTPKEHPHTRWVRITKKGIRRLAKKGIVTKEELEEGYKTLETITSFFDDKNPFELEKERTLLEIGELKNKLGREPKKADDPQLAKRAVKLFGGWKAALMLAQSASASRASPSQRFQL